MPAKAGIQNYLASMDSHLSGNDIKGHIKTPNETINLEKSKSPKFLFARPDMQTAAAVSARAPGVCRKFETCSLKRTVVYAGGNFTHFCNFAVAEACFLPGFLEGTPMKLNINSLRIAAQQFRLEHFPVIRDKRKKSVFKTVHV